MFVPVSLASCDILRELDEIPYVEEWPSQAEVKKNADPRARHPVEEPVVDKALLDTNIPSDLSGLVPGQGCMWMAVAEKVAVRSGPSLAAKPYGRVLRGADVELFDWDATFTWRRFEWKHNEEAWMLMDHPEHGPLLRAKGMPFQSKPISPLSMAAWEGDVHTVRRMLSSGLMSPEEPDA